MDHRLRGQEVNRIKGLKSFNPLTFLPIYLLTLLFFGCSDIYHIQRGDNFFNQANYSLAIEEYEKVVALAGNPKSPYYGLPTGEEAKKKIEISNLALSAKENFSKGNEEFWKGQFQSAAGYYQEIDPQFLSPEESSIYEKNRKEILNFLASAQRTPPPISSQEEAAFLRREVSQVEKGMQPEKEHLAPTSAIAYFPLPAGWRYYYRSSIPVGQKVIVQNLKEEVFPEKILKEKRVIPVQKWQGGKASEILYYQVSEEEVQLVAEQKAPELAPVFLDFPITEIKLPIEPGSSWSVQGKARVIVGREDIAIESEIYSNCLKIVEQQSELLRTTRWYAPQVGLVKLQKTSFPGKTYESHQILELINLEKK